MRSFLTTAFFLILFFSCTGENATQYNDSIIKPQLEIVAYMDSIFSPETNYEEIVEYRQKMVNSADRGLESIGRLGDFRGNESFRNAGEEYYSYVRNYFGTTEGMDSLMFKFNSPEGIETLSEEAYLETQESFKKFLELENNLLSEQQRFAVEFNLKMDYRPNETP